MKKHYSHFHDRTGEEIKNNQGAKMKIIVYNGSDDILVKFEDGYKVKTQYGLFKRGNINNPNFRGANFKDKTGETNINFQNLNMEIIEYINNSNIKIKFEDGYICKTNYNCFKNGKVKSRYSPSVYGIGILGDEPTSDENGNLYVHKISDKSYKWNYYNKYDIKNNPWKIENTEIFHKLNAPTFVYTDIRDSISSLMPNGHGIIINPVFTKLPFDVLGAEREKIISEQNIYIDIENFLWATKQEPESIPDNNTKILAAGFDLKTSFRNVK